MLSLAHQSQSDKYLMLPFQVWRWRSIYKHFLFIILIRLRLHQSSSFAAVRFFRPIICQGKGNVQPLEPEPGNALCTPVQVQARNRFTITPSENGWGLYSNTLL